MSSQVLQPQIRQPKIGILTGPTASGKTGLAIEFASALEAGSSPIEIINADSLLVYRGMNIGTAKPSREELAAIPHHLIDVRDPDQPYNAGDFVADVDAVIREIRSRGARPLIVGGTGFYLKALLYGLWESPRSTPELRQEIETLSSDSLYEALFKSDEVSALRIGKNDRYRLVRATELIRLTGKTPTQLEAEQADRPADPRFELWLIDREAGELDARIAARTQAMLKEGLVEECKTLVERFPGAAPLSSIGYAQVLAYFDGRKPEGRKVRPGLDGLADEITLATRQLVKRQRTWFRGQAEGRWFKMDRERGALQSEFDRIYRTG